MSIPALRRPRLHRGYTTLQPGTTDDLLIYNDMRLFQLQGTPLLKRLLPLLDGRRRVEEIVLELGDIDTADLEAMLETLRDAGLVEEEASATPPDPTQAHVLDFLSHFTDQPVARFHEMVQKPVVVLGLGNVGRAVLDMLATTGFSRLTGAFVENGPDASPRPADGNRLDPWPTRTVSGLERTALQPILDEAALLVVCLDSPQPAILRQVNAACIASDTQWMPVGLRGWEAFWGPAIIPHETACYRCYELRMTSHLTHYEQHVLVEHDRSLGNGSSFGSLPAFVSIIAGMATTEIVKILSHFSPPRTYGRLMTVDLRTLATEGHDIIKVPRCPDCGEPSQRRPMMKPWTA
jgi:bacteriocin biosynthesis cyclodehydratase domain-containing protein